ncbi:MAG: hypothetical protein HY231_23050 [Acidobacteria bacterium]|nr:hypothetical protein [Acidobacteriota bacterium]
MATPKTRLANIIVALALLLSGAGAAVCADNQDDKSYSSVINYLKSNYKAKGQGAFGLVTLARFVVKVIKPAGVKNFKLAMLRDLQFTSARVDDDLGAFMRANVHARWQPLTQVISRQEKQYVYVYFQQEKTDAKFLIVAVQKQNAFIIQFKFSPEKLAQFLAKPEIMGISLTGEDDKKNNSSSATHADDDNQKSKENRKLDDNKKNSEVKPPVAPEAVVEITDGGRSNGCFVQILCSMV